MTRVDVRSEEGHWIVVSDGQTLRDFERFRDAELKARQIAQSRGGGEIVIHARGGEMIEKQSVPSATPSSRTRPHLRLPRIKLG